MKMVELFQMMLEIDDEFPEQLVEQIQEQNGSRQLRPKDVVQSLDMTPTQK